MDKPTPKSKGGRPKKPPTPPVLGVALREGTGYRVNVILAGLVVNGKKFDPQIGADMIADMLAEWMAKIAARRPAAPTETAVQDPDMAIPATNGDAAGGEAEASPELAITPGENGHH